MELGYNITLGSIKENEYKIINFFVSSCWYEHVLKFFVAVNGISERIELIEDTTMLPELRRNDEFLMEEFIAAGVSRDHLKIINYIRMHLKAITLADIATPDGRRITFDAWNVIGSNNLRVDYDWPRSPPSFTQRQKEVWQQAIHKTFIVQNTGRMCRDIRITNILGPWLDNKLRDKWLYHYDSGSNRIYKKRRIRMEGFLLFARTSNKKPSMASS